MDLIKELLKNTYLLRIDKIEIIIERIWEEYQLILDDANDIEKLWEARVYLYFVGWFYPEKFGIEAIDRRLKHLKKPISLIEFLDMIDKGEINPEQKEDLLFVKLERLYRLIKKYKQLVINNSYLDEKRFNEKEKEFMGRKAIEELP